MTNAHPPITPFRKYTPEVMDVLCKLVAENAMSLDKIVQLDPRLPSSQTIRAWLKDHEEFRQAYDIAKECQMDILADEIIEIADHGSDKARDKLKIKTRQWLMSRLNRRLYGERAVIEHEAGVNLADLLQSRLAKIKTIEGESTLMPQICTENAIDVDPLP